MKIQIDGTNTINKGAELMLYAVLEQIQNKHPNADVIFNTGNESNSAKYIDTKLYFRKRWAQEYLGKLILKLKIIGILNKLNLSIKSLTPKYAKPGIDVILDAGGFRFSDQWSHSNKSIEDWEAYYSKLKKYKTKIILLPQAFGPFESQGGKCIANILDKYIDIIFARDETSKNYLLDAGVSLNKVELYPDFTSLVEGVYSKHLNQTKGKVCIIPNFKMIEKTKVNLDRYMSFMVKVITHIRSSNKDVFLLNHESHKDLMICREISKQFDNEITVITGLKAKEVKFLIANSYFVVSSRFHGIASSLSSSTPCIATSWSHKYEMLFRDFDQKDKLIDINQSFDIAKNKIDILLSERENEKIRKQLFEVTQNVKQTNLKMWEKVWSFIDSNSKQN